MLLERKLSKWVGAGLINQKTKDDILAFEAKKSGSYVLPTIVGLGCLAIVVGIVSIVAANWHSIPPTVKLTANSAMLLGLGIGAIVCDRKGLENIVEGLILGLFGVTLASIGLVGQIYNLSDHQFVGLFVWLAATTPIVLFSKFRFTPYMWAIAVATCFMFFLDYLDQRDLLEKPAHYWGFCPIFMLALAEVFGRFPTKENFRNALAHLGTLMACTSVLIMGSGFWVDRVEGNPVVALTVLASALGLSVWYRLTERKAIGLCLALGFTYQHVPMAFNHGNLKEIGGLAFLVMASIWAYLAVKANHKKAFDFACALIGIRLVVIYLEVFGSLMQTGIGLVISGVVILGIALLWHKKRDSFWGRMSQ